MSGATNRTRIAGAAPLRRARRWFAADPPWPHVKRLSGAAKAWILLRRFGHTTWRHRDWTPSAAVSLVAVSTYLGGRVTAVEAAIMLCGASGLAVWTQTHHRQLWAHHQGGARWDRHRHRILRQWQAAWLDAVAPGDENPDEPIPALLRIRDDPHQLRLTVRVPVGMNRNRFVRAAGTLRTHYGTKVRIDDHPDGTATIDVERFDLLASEPEVPRLDHGNADRIVVGRTYTGEASFRMLEASLLICGRRGSGKSSSLAPIVIQILHLPHVRFHLYDPKRGMDVKWAWPFAYHDGRLGVAHSQAEGVALLERAHRLMLEKFERLGPTGAGVATITADCPYDVVCLDELPRLFRIPKGDREAAALAARAWYLLGELGGQGRAVGVVIIAGTQTFRAELFGGDVCGQWTHILGLSTANSTETNLVKSGLHGRGFELSRISLDRSPGLGVWIGGDPDEQWVRTYRLYGRDLDSEVRLLRASRAESLPPPEPVPALLPAPADRDPEPAADPSLPYLPPDSRSRIPVRQLVSSAVEVLEREGRPIRSEELASTWRVDASGVRRVLSKDLGLERHGNGHGSWSRRGAKR